MPIDTISSLAARETLWRAIATTQRRAQIATEEVASGVRHDLGAALGVHVSRGIDMRQVSSEIDVVTTTNEMLASKLDHAQTALSALGQIASGFFETVISARQAGVDRSILVADARSRLEEVVSILSTASNGAHVFSGENTAVAPLENYLADPQPASRVAVVGAFSSEFGMSPDDSGTGAISPAQLESYLDGSFTTLFEPTGWQAAFSNASGGPARARISLNETIDVPIDSGSRGIRQLMSALVAIVDSGTESLNAHAFAALTARAAGLASSAAGEISDDQGRIGIAQERLAKANERMTEQRSIMTRNIADLEHVDILEASTRLNALTTQLEASYAVTSRLQRMSILNYL